MGEERLCFKQSSEVEGLDFGRQLVIRALQVERVHVDEIWQKFLKENAEPMEALKDSEITAYTQTRRGRRLQFLTHTLTLGIATSRAKVVLFLLNSRDLKERAEVNWPERVSLRRVKGCLLESLPECEMVRLKVWKGAITFYVYIVRRRESPLVVYDQFLRMAMKLVAADEVKDRLLYRLPAIVARILVVGGTSLIGVVHF